jgi:hypothetical protein
MYRTRLAALSPLLGKTEVADGSEYGRFWLTFGQGTKVCEAYLERLNRSEYQQHPKCDRPESNAVPGFSILERQSLTVEELQRIWGPVYSYLHTGKPSPRPQDRGRPTESDRKYWPVFRYANPVDVDNDGAADPLVMWRSGNCSRSGPINQWHFWETIPIVLSTAMDGPDVERTRDLVGHRVGGYKLPSGKIANGFRPIGRYMGIFKYEGHYYLDTFFDGWGDFQGSRRNDPGLALEDPEIGNRLAVFLRRGKETRQVCEYWLDDSFARPENATR